MNVYPLEAELFLVDGEKDVRMNGLTEGHDEEKNIYIFGRGGFCKCA